MNGNGTEWKLPQPHVKLLLYKTEMNLPRFERKRQLFFEAYCIMVIIMYIFSLSIIIYLILEMVLFYTELIQ